MSILFCMKENIQILSCVLSDLSNFKIFLISLWVSRINAIIIRLKLLYDCQFMPLPLLKLVLLLYLWFEFVSNQSNFFIVILLFLCINLLDFSRSGFFLVISAHYYMKKRFLGKLLTYVTFQNLYQKKEEEIFC